MEIYSIIKRPVRTEKSTFLKDRQNIYVFFVDKKANKNQIKSAVEKLFNVRVDSVNTFIQRGKIRRVGRFIGRLPTLKKAYVKLKKGYEIRAIEEMT